MFNLFFPDTDPYPKRQKNQASRLVFYLIYIYLKFLVCFNQTNISICTTVYDISAIGISIGKDIEIMS